jgi:hypothetical protein
MDKSTKEPYEIFYKVSLFESEMILGLLLLEVVPWPASTLGLAWPAIATFRYKIDSLTILGVTANNGNESGRAIRSIVAKGESNPTPLFPDDNSFPKPL